MKTKNLRNGIILGSLIDEMMPSSSQRLGLNSFVNCRLWDSNLDGEKFKRWRLWRSSHKSVPKSRAQLDSRTSGLGPTASLWSYRVIANSKRKCRTSHVKVSYFRNTFLVSSIIPKNEQKQFNLRYHSNKIDFSLFIFWENWRYQKRHFEINLPLASVQVVLKKETKFEFHYLGSN